jgi:hypothetical protein
LRLAHLDAPQYIDLLVVHLFVNQLIHLVDVLYRFLYRVFYHLALVDLIVIRLLQELLNVQRTLQLLLTLLHFQKLLFFAPLLFLIQLMVHACDHVWTDHQLLKFLLKKLLFWVLKIFVIFYCLLR